MDEPQEEPLNDDSFTDFNSRGELTSDQIARPMPHFSWSDKASNVSSFSRISQFFGFSTRKNQSIALSDRDLPILSNSGKARAPVNSGGMTALDISPKKQNQDEPTSNRGTWIGPKCCIFQLVVIVMLGALVGFLLKTQNENAETEAILNNCQTRQPTLQPIDQPPPPPPENDFCGPTGRDEDLRDIIANNFQEETNVVTIENLNIDCFPPKAFVLIPSGILNNVVEINLVGLGLTKISARMFESGDFSSLETLRINDNGLSRLPDKFIEVVRISAPSFDRLDLARNAFQTIKNDILGNPERKEMKLISLAENSGLVEIPPTLGLFTKIVKLDLSFCPSLVTSQSGLFDTTEIIEIVLFESNQFSQKAIEVTQLNDEILALQVFLGLDETTIIQV